MQITVAGKQVETGDALKQRVQEQLSALARKYFDHAVEARVTFRRDVKGVFFGCDINMQAGRDLFVRAEGEGTDAHRAFEEATEHLAKRLRRYRRRFNEHARSLAEERVAEMGRQVVLGEAAEGEAAAGEAEHGPIIAEQATEIPRLSVGEAVMRLDLTRLQVLMFRNRASGALNVVYRRSDGCFGWIEPTG
ncbi:MAG TPA: ribosome-associated translation inhibitor RaiA [Crenalkalicoccus sp.]|jgi:ribosomal subunit interface protein|nr:ribosome-associated translation inhibitor RaiA [Crenalkalicoccus sp.]